MYDSALLLSQNLPSFWTDEDIQGNVSLRDKRQR